MLPPSKRQTEKKSPPAPLWLGLVLMATGASAAEPAKDAPWAVPVPVPARLPTAKPRPAQPAPCQPENFIPGETNFKVGPRGKGQYEMEEGIEFSIQAAKALPGGYESITFHFGCASTSSSVLDISRKGKRHALYQHVRDHRVHPTKPVLYFAQSERKQGRYQDFIGLVHLDGKRKLALPDLGCTSGGHALFQEDRLVTYGEAYKAPGNRTDVCVWNLDGKLQARLHADLQWMAAAQYALVDQIGLLPRQPDVFYSLHQGLEGDAGCELRLQSLQRADLSRRIPLGPDCKADFAQVALDAP